MYIIYFIILHNKKIQNKNMVTASSFSVRFKNAPVSWWMNGNKQQFACSIFLGKYLVDEQEIEIGTK